MIRRISRRTINPRAVGSRLSLCGLLGDAPRIARFISTHDVVFRVVDAGLAHRWRRKLRGRWLELVF